MARGARQDHSAVSCDAGSAGASGREATGSVMAGGCEGMGPSFRSCWEPGWLKAVEVTALH